MNRMQEDGRTLTLWELQDSASSMKKALKLERERASYFQSLYDDIRYYAYRYCDPVDSNGESPSVEYQALEILDAKNSYNRRIEKNKEKYVRWTVFLQMVSPKTADILKRRIELRERVEETAFRLAMKEGSKVWEKLEYGRGRSLDDEAKDHLKYLGENFPELFRKSRVKHNYEIDGKMVLMTTSEYEDYQYQKDAAWRKEQQEALRQEFGHHTANESLNALPYR